MFAPIALFLYNRPNHAQEVIEALLKNPEALKSELYIFCDGAKKNTAAEELENIRETQNFAQSVSGFKKVHLKISTANLGLKKSIIQGLSEVLQNNSKVIVLEDDIIVAPHFLHFQNEALAKYLNDNRVAGVSGYSFPIKETSPFFTRTGSCWGWGTFKRVWDNFKEEQHKLDLSQIDSDELGLFNVCGHVYSDMFEKNKLGKLQSWAVEFYVYYFSKKQYFIMPGANLVNNIGFDGSGTHKINRNFLTDNNPIGFIEKIKFPDHVYENKNIRKKIQLLYQKEFARPTLFISLLNKLKSVFLGNEKSAT